MDKQISGNNPLQGAEVHKIKRGDEIKAFQAAPQDDKQNVFFKDRKGDTYVASGKKMDLKGVTPGATIKFNNQDVTVTAVEPGPATADIDALLRDLPWMKLQEQITLFEGMGRKDGGVQALCRIARAARDMQAGYVALATALQQIRSAEDAVEVARTAAVIKAYDCIGPALEKGMQRNDTTILLRFAQEMKTLGYNVQMDFARTTEVKLEKLIP